MGTCTSSLFSHLISTALLAQASPAQILHALESNSPVTADSDHQTMLFRALNEFVRKVPLSDFDYEAYTQYVKSSRLIARELQLHPGEQALLMNGRVCSSLDVFF
jgi:UDP-glucose:glycoprotein glucosyltransferase